MGYDFHLGPQGPRLIEINTNAGGAFLNALMARVQRRCCGAQNARISSPNGFDFAVKDMFQREWRSQRSSGELRRIAITDDSPQEQYLYPEFVIARQMLQKHDFRSEEHTSALQSLMRISSAVSCLKQKNRKNHTQHI